MPVKKTFLVSLESTEVIMERVWDDELKNIIKSGLRSRGINIDVKEIDPSAAK